MVRVRLLGNVGADIAFSAPFSEVPFEARGSYEACHEHLALNERDELVQVFEQSGMSPTGRWLRTRPITPDGCIEIGGPTPETQGHDLAPVDIADPQWKAKAQRWRAQQRGQQLDQRLSGDAGSARPAKPRF